MPLLFFTLFFIVSCGWADEGVGTEFGDGDDEFAEIGGGGLVLGDIALGEGAVLLFASGDEEGDMEVGSRIGGGFALADLGDVL